jgi:hypothetical protein
MTFTTDSSGFASTGWAGVPMFRHFLNKNEHLPCHRHLDVDKADDPDSAVCTVFQWSTTTLPKHFATPRRKEAVRGKWDESDDDQQGISQFQPLFKSAVRIATTVAKRCSSGSIQKNAPTTKPKCVRTVLSVVSIAWKRARSSHTMLDMSTRTRRLTPTMEISHTASRLCRLLAIIPVRLPLCSSCVALIYLPGGELILRQFGIMIDFPAGSSCLLRGSDWSTARGSGWTSRATAS